ncbi:MAG: S8 family serine peptidase [Candidatus Thermoplasmatota archaeon]|nr:S8 family serine peptidase [Candidatus Thermoplasmatota archaeon]
MTKTTNVISIALITLMLLPSLGTIIPADAETVTLEEEGWWVDTTVDRNKNGIGDMIERHIDNPILLKDGTLPIIVDFDHTPDTEDVQMLEQFVGYQHEWYLPGIDAVAGRIPVSLLEETTNLPGVVMLELDGIMTIQNGDAVTLHGVDTAWQETGYDGSGTTVAIIDTGIDGAHASLDDQDDDPETVDPKVVAFYDPVNNPSLTNGTEVFPYDDQGHGSHCAGTTAGTGAPTYENPGMAPQAKLVGVKVLDAGGSGSFAVVMAGMQWTIDNRYQYNIRVASMSLGAFGIIEWQSSEEDSVNRMANEMVYNDITLFIAAGNSAGRGTIGTPGSAEDAITVGALDKDSSIAAYSSQGPTEENRVKPNIAYVGSSVMSVAHNTGDQYTDMSGTSMATPGAAGVAALMLQANPGLSPFEVRNFMQETAEYRACTYMGDPAGIDGCDDNDVQNIVTKNRQNNVYGHGEVRALESVLAAAEKYYMFDTSLSITIETDPTHDNAHTHLTPKDSIKFSTSGGIETIQWRSNHIVDDWTNLNTYERTDTSGEITGVDIIQQLEHLPGIDLDGNHTISIRGLESNESGGHSSSPLVTIDIMMMDSASAYFTETEETPGFTFLTISVASAIAIFVNQRKSETEFSEDD